ncbi:hypothetical protein [Vulcanisaeta distributa]|uniref:hypothetical protein n=1 Tax=Vulcanisaeta distributa TaxID=164451 RepID=UPI0006D26CAF|nr:hypothetical protein [Vulcanisaeta distributa]
MINAVFDRIRVCRGGVRIRGGRRRLTCGGEVDEVTRSEVLNLVGKFLRRVEKYRDVLLGNERTPFDMYIDELENFIGYLRSRLSEVNNPGQLDNAERTIIELRKALLTVSSTMLRLLRRVRKRWLMRGRLELEELIIKLVKSEVTVLVNGELNKEEEGFSIYLYAGHLIVVVEKFPRNRGITVRLMLTNIRVFTLYRQGCLTIMY